MSEWFFFMSLDERREALNHVLATTGATIVSGRLHDSPKVPRFTDALPKEDLETLFPNGSLYILPPVGSRLVLERVGSLERFSVAPLKGGPVSKISLPMLYSQRESPVLKPGVLSRRAEFWDESLKRRNPISEEFRGWHDSLKKVFQERLVRIGRVWISEGAIELVRSKRAVPNLTPSDLAAFTASLESRPA